VSAEAKRRPFSASETRRTAPLSTPRTDSSLVDEARVKVEHALGRHAAVGHHRRVVLGDHSEQRVNLLQLQRRVEALALRDGSMRVLESANPRLLSRRSDWTHLEVVQLGRIEHAVLVDVAELKDPSQRVNAFRF
jgi:hypothetical protein